MLALPFNLIAGPFGMNVGGIPLASHRHGFVTVVDVVAAFTLAAAVFAFRRRDQ